MPRTLSPSGDAAPSRSVLSRHGWKIAVLLIGVFLFYWFQIRPITVYRGCAHDASSDSRKLLQQKYAIAQDAGQRAAYKKLIDQNLYLRSDYTSFLNKCLLYYGMPQSSANLSNGKTGTGAGVE